MINFGQMGELLYATEYVFDINTNRIKNSLNVVIKTDLFQNAIIKTQVKDSSYSDNKIFVNSVEVPDNENKCYKFEFPLSGFASLDVLIDYIERYYRSHVLKEGTPLDRVVFDYDIASEKTENEYKAYIGSIEDGRGSKIDISIDVNKNNIATKTFRELRVIEYETKTDIEFFFLSKYGYFNLKPMEDKYLGYSNYFDKNGDFHSLVYTCYNDTIKDNRLNIIPCFACCYSNIDFDAKEYLDIEYDEFGIYKSNSNNDKYPCIYEKESIGESEFAIYSLHPLHLDFNNFYYHEHDDNIYVMDRLEYVDSGFGEYKVVREVRRLSDEEIKDIRSESITDEYPKLTNLSDIEILSSTIKLSTHF